MATIEEGRRSTRAPPANIASGLRDRPACPRLHRRRLLDGDVLEPLGEVDTDGGRPGHRIELCGQPADVQPGRAFESFSQ